MSTIRLKTLRTVLSFILASCLIIVFPASVQTILAADSSILSGKETQITNVNHRQEYPDIYGNIIVWEDWRNGKAEIYMYDINSGKETRIDRGMSPSIHEHNIVYQGFNNQIFLYDVNSGTKEPIVEEGNHPDIHGNIVVWEDYRNGNEDIHMFDLSTGKETQVTSDKKRETDPAVYGDYIVWTDERNGFRQDGDETRPNEDIYVYKISTRKETRVTSSIWDQYSPAVYEDKIVYVNEDGDSSSINMYNITTGKVSQIGSKAHHISDPSIYGDKIVYSHNDDVSTIFIYDVTKKAESAVLKVNAGGISQPVIYEDKIVWADQRKQENYEIYMYSLNQQTAKPGGTEAAPEVNEISVILDGKKLSFDVPPQTVNGRTLVPMRKIFEALGATIKWDGSTRSVTAVKGDTTIQIMIGKKEAFKDGKSISLDVPGEIINGNTFVPLRFVGEALGAKVGWNDKTRTITISSNGVGQ